MADELKIDPDIARGLPGGEVDLATYEQIESALDAIEAPMQDASGRWLKLHERILALKSN